MKKILLILSFLIINIKSMQFNGSRQNNSKAGAHFKKLNSEEAIAKKLKNIQKKLKKENKKSSFKKLNSIMQKIELFYDKKENFIRKPTSKIRKSELSSITEENENDLNAEFESFLEMIQSLRKRQKKMNNNNNDSNTMEALPKHHYWNFNQRIQFSEKQKNVRKWINVCEKKLSSVLIYSSFESVTKELFEYVFNANIQTYLPDGITQLCIYLNVFILPPTKELLHLIHILQNFDIKKLNIDESELINAHNIPIEERD